MRTFAQPPPRPSPFDYRSIDPRYGAFGWNVAVERPALEFSELRNASGRGFDLLGSGSATVRTARLYRPHSRVIATVRTGAGSKRLALKAGRAGRVTVPVAVGPGNPYQEYSPLAAQAGTIVYAAKVRLRCRTAGRCAAG
jgi:hypothetical protein